MPFFNVLFLHRNRSSSRERIAYNHCSDQQGDTEKRLVTGPAREIDMSNVTLRCIFLQINLNIDIPSRDIKLIIFPSLKFFRTDVISRGHLLLLLLSQKCLLFLSTSHNRVPIFIFTKIGTCRVANKCLTCCITSCTPALQLYT